MAFSAWRSCARAWASCASSTWVSMRASGWPASTKSPSSTSMAVTRPPSWVATSTSVASMRPLPQAKPSPRPPGRTSYQARAATSATTARDRPTRVIQRVRWVMFTPYRSGRCKGRILLCRRRRRGVLMTVMRTPHATAVAPRVLGAVQRLVATGHQAPRVVLALQVGGGDADAQGQATKRAARVRQGQFGETPMDARGQVLGALPAGVGQDDGELLAAVAAGHVALALQAVVQQTGHLAQGVVAGQVAERVVVALEVVDIRQQQRQRCAEPAHAAPFGLQLLVEEAPVVQAGQPVLLGQALQARLHAQPLGIVARHANEELATVAFDQLRADLRWPQGAILAAQLALQQAGRALAVQLAHLLQPLPVTGHEQLGIAAEQRIEPFAVVPQAQVDGAVHVQERLRPQVEDEQAVAAEIGELEDQPLLGAALAQPGGGAPAALRLGAQSPVAGQQGGGPAVIFQGQVQRGDQQ